MEGLKTEEMELLGLFCKSRELADEYKLKGHKRHTPTVLLMHRNSMAT